MKILKITFEATAKEVIITKVEHEIVKETAKQLKTINGDTIKKADLNQVKESYYRDTYKIYARVAWCEEAQVENMIKDFIRIATGHFEGVKRFADEAIKKLKNA